MKLNIIFSNQVTPFHSAVFLLEGHFSSWRKSYSLINERIWWQLKILIAFGAVEKFQRLAILGYFLCAPEPTNTTICLKSE